MLLLFNKCLIFYVQISYDNSNIIIMYKYYMILPLLLCTNIMLSLKIIYYVQISYYIIL